MRQKSKRVELDPEYQRERILKMAFNPYRFKGLDLEGNVETQLSLQLDPKRIKEKGTVRADFNGELSKEMFKEIKDIIERNGYDIKAVLPAYNRIGNQTTFRAYVELKKENQD